MRMYSEQMRVYSNSKSTFIGLNFHLLTDCRVHNIRKQRSIIIKPETSQGSVPQRKTDIRLIIAVWCQITA